MVNALPLFEIVPNISEGRDAAIVDACVEAVAKSGARVIDRTTDGVHHRSVITAVGSADEVLAASVALAGVAAERIDLRSHRGVHPRIGALDVLPFIALRGATLADAGALAREAAKEIWQRHRVPSYYYGAAAEAGGRTLPEVRRGGIPLDVGDQEHEAAGAIAVGARDFLIAFNVELASGDLELARTIARTVRERDGGLGTLRALGLPRAPGVVQVSFNITDPEATPIYRVVELVRALALESGVNIVRSELIGLVPRKALQATAAYYAHDEARL
ncbi:MAG: glutamate formimidoyltransferase [Vulcanimicrobiaceae bacterium]|jgi:glutamate formiminotransferase